MSDLNQIITETQVALNAYCSINTGTCIHCGYQNQKPLKSRNVMTDEELILLDMYEHKFGKRKFVTRTMIPKKVNGYWSVVCKPCFQRVLQ